MAKQEGDIKLTGTIQNITFYKREGKYLARKKSSLTKKKFMKDPKFEGSRRSCRRLARGSQLASLVYNTLPEPKRYYELYCELKSLAINQLKENNSEEEVLCALDKELRKKLKVKRVRVKKVKKTNEPRVFTVLFVREGLELKFGKRRFMRMFRERLTLERLKE